MALTVIDASDASWSLVGDVRLTTRAAIAQWCPPAAGTEDDPILLTFSGNNGLATPSLRFQAAAIVVYGAIIGGFDESISRSIDGGARGGPIPPEDIAAATDRSTSTDAACGIVLSRTNDLETGVQHLFEMSPLGKVEFAIHRVELFDEPIVTTPPVVSSTTTSNSRASLTGTSNTVSTTTTSEQSGPASSSIGVIKSPPSSSPPILAIVVPIVVGVLLLLALVTFLLCRRRRRPVPPDFTIDSYDSAAQLNDMSHAFGTVVTATSSASGKSGFAYPGDATRPYTITSFPASSSNDNDPYARTDEKVRLLHVSDAKSWQGQSSASGSGAGSGATSPGMSTPGVDLDARRPQQRGGGEDAVQMAALSEAMQRAGFSPAALLESLNRVHARADDEIGAASPTTETRTRPPQYRE